MVRPTQILPEIKSRARDAAKNVTWGMFPAKNDEKQFLLVFGCQRSGTTMLLDCLDRDFRAKVFHEYSALSQLDETETNNRIRLRKTEEVRKLVSECPFPLIISKPIVESHRAAQLLASFNGSKAIWIYRNYRDSVNSHVNKFKTQHYNLQSLLEKRKSNWRSEGVSDEIVSTIKPYCKPNLSAADAQALMWYARNMLYFEQDLSKLTSVMLIDYDEICRFPESGFRLLYAFLGLPYPRSSVTAAMSTKSIGLGANLNLSPPIAELCEDLMNRFEQLRISRENAQAKQHPTLF